MNGSYTLDRASDALVIIAKQLKLLNKIKLLQLRSALYKGELSELAEDDKKFIKFTDS